MAGRTLGVLALGLVLRLASAPVGPGSFVTVPQRDRASGSQGPRSLDVSADGRYVAFESDVRLVPADTNDRRDIYVLDLTTRRVTLESMAQETPADAGHPRLSADGRFLVYESTEAASEGLAFQSSIVLCDRTAATARVISNSPDGAPANGPNADPDVSDDGQVVVFASKATNLVAGPDANGRQEDIYAFDVRTGTIRRVSVDSDGVQPSTGASVSPSLSGDGRRVAFVSSAPLLPKATAGRAAPRRNLREVYVRDLIGQATMQVSADARSRAPDGDSWGPAIDRDGRLVAFVSAATSLGTGARNRTPNVFLRDLGTGRLTLVSRAAGGGEGASGSSASPAISADGRFVAFQSDASNLMCRKRCPPGAEDINLLPDVFVFDRQQSSMLRASEDESGGWMEASRGPALDASGEVLAFASRHPIDSLDDGNDFDLFVRVEAGSPPAPSSGSLIPDP